MGGWEDVDAMTPPSPNWYDDDTPLDEGSSCSSMDDTDHKMDSMTRDGDADEMMEYKWKDYSDGDVFVGGRSDAANDLMWGGPAGYASPLAALLDMTPPQSPFHADKPMQLPQCPPMMLPIIGNPEVVATVTVSIPQGVLKPTKKTSKRKSSTSSIKTEKSSRGSVGDRLKDNSSPTLDGLPENKRSTHNVLERKRRHDLKNSYKALRAQIPGIENNERTPTGVILVRAHDVIQELQDTQTDLMQQIEAMKQRNDVLRQSSLNAPMFGGLATTGR